MISDGNKDFRSIVKLSSQRYLECQSPRERAVVVQSLIDHVHKRDGRFLRKSQVHGHVSTVRL
jgi:hypothetical protein